MRQRAKRGFVLAVASISLGASGILGFGALYGCDTGDAASPQNLANRDSGLSTTTDGSVATDATADAADGSVQDTGIADSGPPSEAGPSLNGCTTYIDHRGDTNVNLIWGYSVASEPNHCSKIAPGSTVTWIAAGANFSTHPLVATAGMGDTPNPIDMTGAIDSGGGGDPTVTITFTDPGAFPYNCGAHPFMLGAIVVDGPVDAGSD